ncbi:MAG: hypothetical protein KKC14_06605 [Alphaproteobacteria bacterium]|nr:hypothetical protein [Alphaproteobacteria bacterium]
MIAAALENAMDRKVAIAIALLMGAVSAATARAAPPASSDCFSLDRVQDWSAADDQTLYLKVDIRDYYRVVLPYPVKPLRSRSSKLVMESRDGQVCGANDLGLSLALSPTQTLTLRADTVTRLSDAEVTAIGLENLPGRFHRRH